ncbi:hypothetical protein ACEZCY_26180 [Streptacidiphilus sp. N1-12]|uniref:Uncharacterized protein n=2 Tax=Streptacidiphilus alkalitolerans TaxID=3342712 RepID=A0ABV6WKY3_9ACTN
MTPAAQPPDAAELGPGLERWRLILGAAAERRTGPLGAEAAARDAALEWLYGRDPDHEARGVRRTPPTREGGQGPSPVTAVDWLDQIHRLFPRRRSSGWNGTRWSATSSTRSSPIPPCWSGSSPVRPCSAPCCAPST